MAEQLTRFEPDYAVPPGWVLEERLEAMELSQAEFARRCGRSAKMISEIIHGRAPIEPETAIQFERVLSVSAKLWLNLESNFQLRIARANDAEAAEQGAEWYAGFPVGELVNRNVIQSPPSVADGVRQLLEFFGVGSISAWQMRYAANQVAFRHSKAFKSKPEVLACWLRLGEIKAGEQRCEEFEEQKFRSALRSIRNLTRENIEISFSETQKLCNAAGVAVVLVKEFRQTSLSGAAKWLSPRKALIQLSARHKSDDHFWFSFFHEAAHLLLHSKREVFVDQHGNGDSAIEDEANQWASNFLIPNAAFVELSSSPTIGPQKIKEVASGLGIADGIVVGMLQHSGKLPWASYLNRLKVRYEWKPGN